MQRSVRLETIERRAASLERFVHVDVHRERGRRQVVVPCREQTLDRVSRDLERGRGRQATDRAALGANRCPQHLIADLERRKYVRFPSTRTPTPEAGCHRMCEPNPG
jgi:hypothetical protein